MGRLRLAAHIDRPDVDSIRRVSGVEADEGVVAPSRDDPDAAARIAFAPFGGGDGRHLPRGDVGDALARVVVPVQGLLGDDDAPGVLGVLGVSDEEGSGLRSAVDPGERGAEASGASPQEQESGVPSEFIDDGRGVLGGGSDRDAPAVGSCDEGDRSASSVGSGGADGEIRRSIAVEVRDGCEGSSEGGVRRFRLVLDADRLLGELRALRGGGGDEDGPARR